MDKTEQQKPASRKSIYKALLEFYKLMGTVGKTGDNPYFKSKYCTLDHLQDRIKEPLQKCGLIVIQGINESGYVKTEVVHVESGESVYCFFPLKTVKEDAQGYGSAMTYAKRYSLSGILNVTIAGEDDDGNKASYVGNPDVNEKPKLNDKGMDTVIARLTAGEDIYQKTIDTFELTDEQFKKLKEVKQSIIKEV